MRTPPFPASTEAAIKSSHALHKTGLGLDTIQADIETLITNSILNTPRSLQETIGPSEVGMSCDHCLAARLAGWEKVGDSLPWAATVGTAVHALLENYIYTHQTRDPDSMDRYYTEHPVTVGTISGQQITGSVDVIDTLTGATIDWKVVSKTQLAKYKREGPTPQYRVQAHLYARGANNAGIKVDTVSIAFLPRQSNNYMERYWWSEPYNPLVAEKALTRANTIANSLTALAAVGEATRDAWISGLPRANDCWDCARYPDAPPPAPQMSDGVLMDLQTGKENRK